jgi:hypothetical protein
VTETLEQAWPLIGRVQHLSATQLAMFSRCPEQWRQRYLLGKRERPGAALIWGGADHKAHEHNFRQKIQTHEDLPEKEVCEAFANAWDTAVQESGGFAEIEWGDEKPSAMKDKGVELAAQYHALVSPLVQPVDVEKRIDHWVDGVEIPVIGYIDVETERSGIERKTSKRRMTKPKPDWEIQRLIYQQELGKPIELHICVKTGEVITSRTDNAGALRLEPKGGNPVDRLIQALAGQMADLYTRYGPDDPWPGAITHPWACSWCGFRPSCAWWSHERKAA